MGLGEINLEPPSENQAAGRDLERAIRSIRRLNPHPHIDEGIEPGQWISFDARLSYKFRTWRRYRDEPGILDSLGASSLIERQDDTAAPSFEALFFWEPEPLPPGAVRLLLHGSPRHLLGNSVVPEASFNFSSGPDFAAWLAAADDLNRARGPRADALANIGQPFDRLTKCAGQLIRDLDRGLPDQRREDGRRSGGLRRDEEPAERVIDLLAAKMAGRMTGYARVTIVFNLESKFDNGRLVVASPLFVERQTVKRRG